MLRDWMKEEWPISYYIENQGKSNVNEVHSRQKRMEKDSPDRITERLVKMDLNGATTHAIL